jgi:hypothetical protein
MGEWKMGDGVKGTEGKVDMAGGAAMDEAALLFLHTEDLYTRSLFAAVAAFTLAAMWFGACEMMASSPVAWIATLPWVQHRHLPEWLPTIYLPLIGAYGGVREWMRYKQTKHDDLSEIMEAQRLHQKVSRELMVMMGWLAYLFLVFCASASELVGKVPDTILYVATEGVIVLTGSHVLHKNHTNKMRRLQRQDGIGVFKKAKTIEVPETAAAEQSQAVAVKVIPQVDTPAAEAALPGADADQQKKVRLGEEHYRQVLDYLGKNECVTNGECRQMTGLSEAQVRTLFIDLKEADKIEQTGDKKSTKYRLKRPDEGQIMG